MSGHIELWAWDSVTGIWRKVLVDAAGNLQVMEQGTPNVNIHGWDGTSWRNLLVESAALYNLRVKLFDGANGIGAGIPILGSYDPRALHHLNVRNIPHVLDWANAAYPIRAAESQGDASGGHYNQIVALYGYNEVSYDRLRSYPTGILKVGRAELPSTTTRLVAAGQVVAGAHNLYWATINPSGPNSNLELSDDLNGLGAIVWDFYSSVRQATHFIFDPPLKFTTGIYLKTFAVMTSVAFCYI